MSLNVNSEIGKLSSVLVHLPGAEIDRMVPSMMEELLFDDILFGEMWKRTELSAKERSLVTVAALTTLGNTDQLVFHLDYARQNGNTEAELIEAITHLAFYTGWPKAFAAMTVAKSVFRPASDVAGNTAD